MTFSSNELFSYLSACDSGLYFISAPSGCEKTKLIRDIASANPDSVILSCEEFTETVISLGLPDDIDGLSRYKYICIEDIDLRGRFTFTARKFANIFRRLSETSVVIVTGIDLQSRTPALFSSLGEYCLFEHFTDNYFSKEY